MNTLDKSSSWIVMSIVASSLLLASVIANVTSVLAGFLSGCGAFIFYFLLFLKSKGQNNG